MPTNTLNEARNHGIVVGALLAIRYLNAVKLPPFRWRSATKERHGRPWRLYRIMHYGNHRKAQSSSLGIVMRRRPFCAVIARKNRHLDCMNTLNVCPVENGNLGRWGARTFPFICTQRRGLFRWANSRVHPTSYPDILLTIKQIFFVRVYIKHLLSFLYWQTWYLNIRGCRGGFTFALF